MGKRILPTQRNTAFQNAVKKMASAEKNALFHIEKFIFAPLFLSLFNAVLGIISH